MQVIRSYPCFSYPTGLCLGIIHKGAHLQHEKKPVLAALMAAVGVVAIPLIGFFGLLFTVFFAPLRAVVNIFFDCFKDSLQADYEMVKTCVPQIFQEMRFMFPIGDNEELLARRGEILGLNDILFRPEGSNG